MNYYVYILEKRTVHTYTSLKKRKKIWQLILIKSQSFKQFQGFLVTMKNNINNFDIYQ